MSQAENAVDIARRKRDQDALQERRYRELLQSNSISKVDYENALLQYQNSEASYRSALESYKNQQQQARQQLISQQAASSVNRIVEGKNQVRALIGGKVYKKYKEAGDYVRRGDVFLGGLETRVPKIWLPRRFLPFAENGRADAHVHELAKDARITFYADGSYGWTYVESAGVEERRVIGAEPLTTRDETFGLQSEALRELAQRENLTVVMLGAPPIGDNLERENRGANAKLDAHREAMTAVGRGYHFLIADCLPGFAAAQGGSLRHSDGIHKGAAGHRIQADSIMETLRTPPSPWAPVAEATPAPEAVPAT